MTILSRNLIVLMGVPGSGKTTWASRMFAGGADYVSSDHIRHELFGELVQDQNDLVFGLFHYRILRALQRGHTVVADSTALDKTARLKLIDIADYAKASVQLVWFADWKEAVARNKERQGSKRVPADVMERMVNKHTLSELQVPTEPFDSVTIIQSTQEPRNRPQCAVA